MRTLKLLLFACLIAALSGQVLAQEKKVVFISEFVDKTDGLGVITDPLPKMLSERIDALGRADARAPGEVQAIADIKTAMDEGVDADMMKKAFSLSVEEAEKLKAAGADFILFGVCNILNGFIDGAIAFNFALVDVETREVAVGLTATPAPFMTGGQGGNDAVFQKVDKIMEKHDEIVDKLARIISIYINLPHEERVARYGIDEQLAMRDSKNYKGSWMLIGYGSFGTLVLPALGIAIDNCGGECVATLGIIAGPPLIGMGLSNIVQRKVIDGRVWNMKRLYKKKFGHKYEDYREVGE